MPSTIAATAPVEGHIIGAVDVFDAYMTRFVCYSRGSSFLKCTFPEVIGVLVWACLLLSIKAIGQVAQRGVSRV